MSDTAHPVDDDSAFGHDTEALAADGAAGRHALVRLLDRGDWRTRVVALATLGRMVRHDRSARRRWSPASVLARVPGVRKHVRGVGWRGRLVSAAISNAATDGLFIVRTAAALALGECRDPGLLPLLERMQDDTFRPVRLAVAAALQACGAPHLVRPLPATLEPTPDLVAEGASTRRWLDRLAAAHLTLLTECAGGAGTAAAVAAWLAGTTQVASRGGIAFEAARYEHEVDLSYQLQKPFGHEDRRENLRQLDALVTLLAHLDLPRGARVVDLGGGSGWVAEILARFGFRPFVVDVALPLLRLARQRLHGAGSGAVVAGDMTALPLAPQSVDAVIVLDALHHVSRLSEVLAEVRRVLAPGGLFLLGEPGEGHSETPKSLAETHEHGVREGEVHPQDVWTRAARAGFTSGAIVPRVPATVLMPLADLAAAMRTPADRWLVQDGATQVRFEPLVLRSMLARPLLVLRSGTRQADSRAPGVLHAAIVADLHRAGRGLRGTVRAENRGDTVWLADTGDGVGVVSVGVQLLGPTQALVNREFWRGRLAGPVAPGEWGEVTVAADLPDAAAAYHVKVDLVAEGVCWFEDRGSRATVVAV